MRWRYYGAGAAIILLLVMESPLIRARRDHSSAFGHPAPFGLHADLIESHGSIGIPGVTKMYGAELANYGFLPVSVSRCDFISDTATPGTMIAYSVEWFNRRSGRWETLVSMNDPDSCMPHLGMGHTRLSTRLLWPGQSLATGEEATAARGQLQGNLVRFVIHLKAGAADPSLATPAILIDESPAVDAGALRLRH